MATAKKPNNFFRGPWFWVLLAALILFPLVGTLTTGSSGRVDTNVGLQLLREGQVAEAKIYDGQQKVELQLEEDLSLDGRDLGRSVEFLMPERFRATHAQHVRRFGSTGTTSRRMGDGTILHGLRSSGEEFPMEASISQLDTGYWSGRFLQARRVAGLGTES